MSKKNKRIVEKILKEFAKKNNASYLDYLADNIRWNIVGMPSISGKSEFVKAVVTLEIENFPSVNVDKIIAEGDYVVVESRGKDINETGENNSPAYCDIYCIKNGKIQELTTYVVDTTITSEIY